MLRPPLEFNKNIPLLNRVFEIKAHVKKITFLILLIMKAFFIKYTFRVMTPYKKSTAIVHMKWTYVHIYV